MDNKKFLIVLTISLIYLTYSVACDPLAYRLVDIFGVTISGSVMLYSALYPMLDMLTRLLGRSMVIIMVIIFHFCDFLFSYALFLVNLMPHPAFFHNLEAFNIVITPIPRMFWAGIIGAVIAGIIEVIIYAFIQHRIKNFFLAAYLSTAIVVIGHGVPTDYFAFIKAFPEQVWSLTAANIAVNLIILGIYIAISSLVMRSLRKEYLHKL